MTKRQSVKNATPSEAVKRYMRTRGVSNDLAESGLDGAIDRWDAIARSAKNYDFTLDDWLNDMDLRDIIEGSMQSADAAERESFAKRLASADERLRKGTVETGSIWGKATESEYDPAKTWWYFRRPINPGEDMIVDLEAAGLK